MELDVGGFSCPLLEPPAATGRIRRLAEDDRVAAVGENQLEILPPQGLRRPRSSTSHCSRTDPDPVHRPRHAAGVGRDLDRARPVDLRPRHPRSGGEDRPPLGHARARIDLDHPQQRVASGRHRGEPPRPAGCGAGPAAGASAACSPISGPSSSARNPAGGRAGKLAESRDDRQQEPLGAGAGARSAIPVPAAAGGEPGLEPNARIVLPARAGRASRRSTSNESACSSCGPGAGRRMRSAKLLGCRPGAQRLVGAHCRPRALAETPNRSARPPRRAARARPGARTSGSNSRFGAPRRAACLAGCSPAVRRPAAQSCPLIGDRRRLAGAHPCGAGAEPVRTRRRTAPAAGLAACPRETPRQGSVEARNGSRPKNASPGRVGSTAAPSASRRRSESSQTASARTGSAATSSSAGTARERLADRISARTPNASAAPDASPTTCGPPGSGARATGLPSSPSRSSSALVSESRGMRAQAISIGSEHMFV